MSEPTKEHELKCWPEFFEKLLSGEKTFEVRKDDRGFRAGDVLWLREWGAIDGYTGRELRMRVTYLMGDGWTGIGPHHVVMAVRALAPPAQTQQGLSGGGAASLRSENAYLNARIERLGHAPSWATAWCCVECEAEDSGPRLNLEKQPSPAAAPAQLSEDGSGERILTLETALREMLKGPPWSSTHEAEARAMAEAALAGQPAPTDDDDLVVCNEERFHWHKLNEGHICRYPSPPPATDDQKALRAAAMEEGAESVGRLEPYVNDPLCKQVLIAVADHLRALAGSPAQQGQLSKEGAK